MTKMPLYLIFVRLSSEGLKENAVVVAATDTTIVRPKFLLKPVIVIAYHHDETDSK